MAIMATVQTDFGFERQLYIRLNNAELSKHDGVYATFRGFDSREAFESGTRYMYEKEVWFNLDSSKPIHTQCYAHLKEHIVNATDV